MNLIPSDHPTLHTRAPYLSNPLPELMELLRIAEEMHNFLDGTGIGVGLSATQIGLPIRLFIINYGGRRLTCLHPEIIKTDGNPIVDFEGCLSYPGQRVPVSRYPRIKVQFMNLGGNVESFYMKDMMARIYQHELDHLNGITILDRTKELDQ